MPPCSQFSGSQKLLQNPALPSISRPKAILILVGGAGILNFSPCFHHSCKKLLSSLHQVSENNLLTYPPPHPGPHLSPFLSINTQQQRRQWGTLLVARWSCSSPMWALHPRAQKPFMKSSGHCGRWGYGCPATGRYLVPLNWTLTKG